MASADSTSDAQKSSIDCKRVFVWFVRIIKIVAVLALLLYGVACGLIAKSAVQSTTLSNQGKAFNVLAQSGYMIFVIALVIAEFGFAWFEKGLYILHFWLGRGLFLGWIGIQAINEGEQIVSVVSGAQTSIDPNAINSMTAATGYTLISVGLLYVLMSVLCLQRIVGVSSMEEVDSGFNNLASAEEGKGSKYESSSSSSLAAPLNSGTGGFDDEDARLLVNTAAALGMTVRELRQRFSGTTGAREADRYFKDQQTRLAQAAQQAKTEAAGKSSAKDDNDKKKNKGGKDERSSSIKKDSTVSSYAAPSQSAFAQDDATDKKHTDEDDLEAMYYGGAKQLE